MRRGMYPKLAAQNLVKNKQIYVPYLITCMCTIAMFYIMMFLSGNKALDTMIGGQDVRMILNLGIIVIVIFSVIFLIYSNSFLMKRRKKELGLYNVLGMEKKHISRILLWEQFYTIMFSFVGGLGFGILGSKLMLLLLLKILKFPVSFGFEIAGNGIVMALALFGGIFLLIFLLNIRQIHMVNPIELLKGSNAGEREPKAKWLIALLGVISTGAGYYIAITVESPLDALLLFFVAVLLVMAGTYLLFTAGSIAVLKFLRWKKGFYYKTSNFISVSGMIYRMKQNAVGLASICILSTGVLLMISSTVSLYLGQEDILKKRFPKEIQVSIWRADAGQMDAFAEGFQAMAEEDQVELSDIRYYRNINVTAVRENGELTMERPESYKLPAGKELVGIWAIPLEDYNRLDGKDHKLGDEEMLLYKAGGAKIEETVTIQGREFSTKPLENFSENGFEYGVKDMYYMVLNDTNIQWLDAKQKEVYGDNYSIVMGNLSVEPILETDEEKIAFTEKAQEYFYEFVSRPENEHVSGFVEGRTNSRQSFYVMYGGMFFLGLFLGGLFLMGTALIIYYKQVSEGYEDQKRYEIMQKVGLSKREVRGSIRSQVVMVFFLPLLMAMVHIGFAFPLIRRLLSIFYLDNVKLFALCTLGTIGVFALVYGVIYLLTAKVYYKIVKA